MIKILKFFRINFKIELHNNPTNIIKTLTNLKMKNFFNKIDNVVKKGNAMVNIPLLKEEKKTKELELQKMKEEYEEKKSLRETSKSVIDDINRLIKHNINTLEKISVKEFADKEGLVSLIRKTNVELNFKIQNIQTHTSFDEKDYTDKIKELDDRISKLQRDLTKFRDIVKQ